MRLMGTGALESAGNNSHDCVASCKGSLGTSCNHQLALTSKIKIMRLPLKLAFLATLLILSPLAATNTKSH
jgi:hypothetical protein